MTEECGGRYRDSLFIAMANSREQFNRLYTRRFSFYSILSVFCLIFPPFKLFNKKIVICAFPPSHIYIDHCIVCPEEF